MSNVINAIFELRALWFILFFVALAFIFWLKNEYNVRQPFLVGFFTLLLLTSVVGTHFFPFMVWDKFPTTYPEVETDYEIRIVTTDDQEIPYDFRATLGADGLYEPYLTPKMANEYSFCKNIEIMSYLLERALEHRERVEKRSGLNFLRFPPHGFVYIWSKKQIRKHGNFTGIRLYEREIRSSKDGTEIESMSEKLVLEYNESKEYAC